jgi:hypothetical protein
MIEHLSSWHNALSSNPNTEKKKKSFKSKGVSTSLGEDKREANFSMTKTQEQVSRTSRFWLLDLPKLEAWSF